MFVKSSRLENQEMDLVVTCQDRYDAIFVEFLSQETDVMTGKKILQPTTPWICTVIVVIAWSVQNQEIGQGNKGRAFWLLHMVTG